MKRWLACSCISLFVAVWILFIAKRAVTPLGTVPLHGVLPMPKFWEIANSTSNEERGVLEGSAFGTAPHSRVKMESELGDRATSVEHSKSNTQAFSVETATSASEQATIVLLELQWRRIRAPCTVKYLMCDEDQAWMEGPLHIGLGDKICMDGNGYAGFNYPEGPPSFGFNLRHGAELLIHFNPRRGQRVLVVTSAHQGKWRKEQREPFPSALERVTANFSICIELERNKWHFYLNGEPLNGFLSYPRFDITPSQGLSELQNVTVELLYVVHPRLYLKRKAA